MMLRGFETTWSEAWRSRRPTRDPAGRGAMAQALCAEDWAEAKRLLEMGLDGWRVAPDGAEEDFFASLNPPPMAHWLLGSAPWALCGWMELMSERFGSDELKKSLARVASAETGVFGGHTPLAGALMGAREEEAQAAARGLEPEFGPWLSVCQELIARGADPSHGDAKDRSCFNFLPEGEAGARLFGQLLRSAGGDPRRGLERGNSFLEEGARRGASAWVRLALVDWALGSDSGPGRPDALRWACSAQGEQVEGLSEEAFDALIRASADPLAADFQGLSPLGHLAATPRGPYGREASERWRADRALQLMRAGADPTRPERDGKSPLDLARAGGGDLMANAMLAALAASEAQALGAEAAAAKVARAPKGL